MGVNWVKDLVAISNGSLSFLACTPELHTATPGIAYWLVDWLS